MANKIRLEFPDRLKGLAVLFMIQVHLMELFTKETIFSSTLGSVSLFLGGIPAAPVFMLVMGYFLAFGKKNPKAMATRGMRLFLGGILLNIGLNAHLLYNIQFKDWQINPWNYIFGVDILPLAGLSLLALALIQKLAKKRIWIYFGLAFAIALLSNFFSPLQFENHSLRYVLAFFSGGTSWSYFPLIPWLTYPLLGYGFKLAVHKLDFESLLKKIWIKIGLFIIALILILSAGFGIDNSIILTDYYHFNFLFFLWSIGFILVWIYLLYLINKQAKNTLFFIYLQFLGKNVTVIYVIQWLLIGNIGTAIYKTQDTGAWIFWFLNISIISSVLTYLWTKNRSNKSKQI
ncbi:MAG: acyltransferase family protein [Bacteroidales bacterium]|nr:acyltransferase family protein [Bacteroidales bacterium]